jgi:hypothetical protein
MTGVLQGDVFGSFLYSLAQQPYLDRALQGFPTISLFADVDDRFIGGPPADAVAADAAVSQWLSEECNIAGNPSKAQVLFCSANEATEEIIDLCSEAGLPAPTKAMKAVGRIVSADADPVIAHLRKRSVTTELLLKRLRNSHLTVQNRLALLRHCCLPRANYDSRVNSPGEAAASQLWFDEHAYEALHVLLECTARELGDTSLIDAQAGLPIRHGGLGMRPLHDYTSHAAFVSAHAAAAVDVCELRQRLRLARNVLDAHPTDAALRASIMRLRELGANLDDLLPDPDQRNFFGFYASLSKGRWKRFPRVQKHVLTQMDKRKQQQLLDLLRREKKMQDLARIISLQSKTARIPILIKPNSKALKVDDDHYTTFLRLRHGLAPLDLPRFCACGFEHANDHYHFMRCTKNTQMWNDSHNDVVDAAAHEMRAAGMYTNCRNLSVYQREFSVIPDIEFVCQGQMHTVDVSLTTSSLKGMTAKEQARAANDRENKKEKKYAGLATFKSSTFHPCVFERDTLSSGKRTKQLINLITAEAIRNGRQITSPFLLTAILLMTVIASTGRFVQSVISRDLTHAYDRQHAPRQALSTAALSRLGSSSASSCGFGSPAPPLARIVHPPTHPHGGGSSGCSKTPPPARRAVSGCVPSAAHGRASHAAAA